MQQQLDDAAVEDAQQRKMRLTNNRDENLTQSKFSAFKAIPFAGVAVPLLGVVSYGPKTLTGPKQDLAGVAKYGVAGGLLPASTIVGGPVAWPRPHDHGLEGA